MTSNLHFNSYRKNRNVTENRRQLKRSSFRSSSFRSKLAESCKIASEKSSDEVNSSFDTLPDVDFYVLNKSDTLPHRGVLDRKALSLRSTWKQTEIPERIVKSPCLIDVPQLNEPKSVDIEETCSSTNDISFVRQPSLRSSSTSSQQLQICKIATEQPCIDINDTYDFQGYCDGNAEINASVQNDDKSLSDLDVASELSSTKSSETDSVNSVENLSINSTSDTLENKYVDIIVTEHSAVISSGKETTKVGRSSVNSSQSSLRLSRNCSMKTENSDGAAFKRALVISCILLVNESSPVIQSRKSRSSKDKIVGDFIESNESNEEETKTDSTNSNTRVVEAHALLDRVTPTALFAPSHGAHNPRGGEQNSISSDIEESGSKEECKLGLDSNGIIKYLNQQIQKYKSQVIQLETEVRDLKREKEEFLTSEAGIKLTNRPANNHRRRRQSVA